MTRLRVHLKPLEHASAVDIWDDTKIRPGAKWHREIQDSLQVAKVAVLLVSANFLASDFITAHEVPRLLQAAEQDGALILPLILSPSRFLRTEGLSQFQAINDPSKPLINMTTGEQEGILARLAEYIEEVLAASPLHGESAPKVCVSESKFEGKWIVESTISENGSPTRGTLVTITSHDQGFNLRFLDASLVWYLSGSGETIIGVSGPRMFSLKITSDGNSGVFIMKGGGSDKTIGLRKMDI